MVLLMVLEVENFFGTERENWIHFNDFAARKNKNPPKFADFFFKITNFWTFPRPRPLENPRLLFNESAETITRLKDTKIFPPIAYTGSYEL